MGAQAPPRSHAAPAASAGRPSVCLGSIGASSWLGFDCSLLLCVGLVWFGFARLLWGARSGGVGCYFGWVLVPPKPQRSEATVCVSHPEHGAEPQRPAAVRGVPTRRDSGGSRSAGASRCPHMPCAALECGSARRNPRRVRSRCPVLASVLGCISLLLELCLRCLIQAAGTPRWPRAVNL